MEKCMPQVHESRKPQTKHLLIPWSYVNDIWKPKRKASALEMGLALVAEYGLTGSDLFDDLQFQL